MEYRFHDLYLSREDSVENGDISQVYILFMILYSKFNNPNMLCFELQKEHSETFLTSKIFNRISNRWGTFEDLII